MYFFQLEFSKIFIPHPNDDNVHWVCYYSIYEGESI